MQRSAIPPLTATLLVVSSLFSISANAAEDVSLGAPFADQAVLQRDMKVPVWGWAEPGTTITVHFANQEKSATATILEGLRQAF